MTIRRSKVRELAHMQDCTLQIPDVCCHDPYTTVLAHLPVAGGGTNKRNIPGEPNAVFACHKCHDVLDGRVQANGAYDHWVNTMEARDLRRELRRVNAERNKLFYMVRGLIRTFGIRLEAGV